MFWTKLKVTHFPTRHPPETAVARNPALIGPVQQRKRWKRFSPSQEWSQFSQGAEVEVTSLYNCTDMTMHLHDHATYCWCLWAGLDFWPGHAVRCHSVLPPVFWLACQNCRLFPRRYNVRSCKFHKKKYKIMSKLSTHTRTHARTHARTHTNTHTHTHKLTHMLKGPTFGVI